MVRSALLTLALLAPLPAAAQSRAAAWHDATLAAARARASTSPLLATASSVAVPGLGQLLLGQRRWTVYAAVELVGWVVHLDRARQGRRFREEYRDLAWATARGMSQPRSDASWEYYERLGSWARSGRFDRDGAAPGIQPETDSESYNGSIWELARDLYLPPGAGPDHPGWGSALEYYEGRAVGPAFLWDWTGREESLADYRELIDRSDEALRTATVVLGAVVANHLLSAVDAFVSTRVGSAPPVSADVGWRPLSGGTVLEWRVRVRP